MIKQLEEILEDGLSEEQVNFFYRSFKNISENTAYADNPKSKQFPTRSNVKAIDFDNIKTIYMNTLNKEHEEKISFRSNDALFCSSDREWFFIEFKDGVTDTDVINEVYEKIEDSLDILWDIEKLEQGYLKVDGDRTLLVEPEDEQESFHFKTKLEKIGFKYNLDYVRNNFNYIFVYNRDLYKETAQDKEFYRKQLKSGAYQNLIDFLNDNIYICGKESPKDFLTNQIEKGNFKDIIKNIERAKKIEESEDKYLIKYFDDNPNEKIEWIIKTCKNIVSIIKETCNIEDLDGKQFLTAILVLSFCKKKLLDEVYRIKEKYKLDNNMYEDLISKLKENEKYMPVEDRDNPKEYIRKIIYKGEKEFEALKNDIFEKNREELKLLVDTLKANVGGPKNLFNLVKFKGKKFKEVYTYTEQEFERLFIEKYSNE